jgi:hypothetical protein
VEAVPAGGEADRDVTAAQRGERAVEAVAGRRSQSLRPEALGRKGDRPGRPATAVAVDRGHREPVTPRTDEPRVQLEPVRSDRVRSERHAVEQERYGHDAARARAGRGFQRRRTIHRPGRPEQCHRGRSCGGR